ncbi:MAG: CaiB/BaiF CoA transferase family protein, partial [Alphaproteobacteria bacterium]
MPLSGIRVIDAGSFIAGPAAATVMGDFGAEVIKIEPPEGDSYRRLGDAPGNPTAKDDYAWIVESRNKQSVALDLKQPAAREVLATLVKGADVFLTNMPLNVRTRLGIRWEDIGPLNDRLIYASLSAYGETGEEASKTGFDSTAWWARSGLMDNVRSAPDAPPARSLPGMGDHATAMSLFGAIMLALYRRERTGKGGLVSTSLMANGVWSNAFLAQARLCGAPFRRRPRREEALNALNNLYEAADGRWFMLAMVSEERQWPGLVRALGRPELEHDPRFATKPARIENARTLVAEFDRIFAARDYAWWRARMDENGVTFGSI